MGSEALVIWSRVPETTLPLRHFSERLYVKNAFPRERELCCCPKCNNIVLEGDEVDKPGEQSVCCEECNVWWHWDIWSVQK